jgi:uncharacterized protein YprB with RNaseH-like and TPR domain
MVSSPLGDYFLVERIYPKDHLHGGRPLARFADYADAPGLFHLPAEALPARMVFMDTETTGLAGGAGTFAFLVGTGSFGPEGFRIRQYFLPDPAGEAAMLEDALGEMETAAALVTFNGRTFDVPILQTRAALRLRRINALARTAHLDLLAHARRLWRRKLESCALGSLERELLGVVRSVEDVPSSLIPYLYREYLQSGDPVRMTGILYHNAIDILSMATLADEILQRYSLPPGEIPDPLEALSLAFAFRQEGRAAESERTFRAALGGRMPPAPRADALRALGMLLKQRHASGEALAVWEEWSALAPDDPAPSTELAKHYEWRNKDYPQALAWAEKACDAAVSAGAAPLRRATEHRIQRLRKKITPP